MRGIGVSNLSSTSDQNRTQSEPFISTRSTVQFSTSALSRTPVQIQPCFYVPQSFPGTIVSETVLNRVEPSQIKIPCRTAWLHRAILAVDISQHRMSFTRFRQNHRVRTCSRPPNLPIQRSHSKERTRNFPKLLLYGYVSDDAHVSALFKIASH
jgi:hypothetical protein